MDLVRDLGELSKIKYDIALLEEMEGNYSKVLEFARRALEINERLRRELEETRELIARLERKLAEQESEEGE
jgi:predicted RNase H-like nuclease (RuvC/YqgF family)